MTNKTQKDHNLQDAQDLAFTCGMEKSMRLNLGMATATLALTTLLAGNAAKITYDEMNTPVSDNANSITTEHNSTTIQIVSSRPLQDKLYFGLVSGISLLGLFGTCAAGRATTRHHRNLGNATDKLQKERLSL